MDFRSKIEAIKEILCPKNYQMINKTSIVILFLLLQFSTSFAQENKIIDAFNLRYENKELCKKNQEKILQNAKNDNDKIISYSFLSLSYLKFKEVEKANDFLEKATSLLSANSSEKALSYYYYALNKYKFYIDDATYVDDLLKSFQLFEKTNNDTFAAITAIKIAYEENTVNVDFLNKSIHYAEKSKNNDAILEAYIGKSNFLLEKYVANRTQQNFIEADKCHQFMLSIAEKKEVYNKANIPIAYLNYANFLIEANKTSAEVTPILSKAIQYSKKYEILSVFTNSYGINALLLEKEGKLNEAEETYKEGVSYLKTLPFVGNKTLKAFYQNLKLISVKKNDYHSYYLYDLEYLKISEIINKEDESQLTNKTIAKYKLQSKNTEIALLNEKNKLKNVFVFGAGIILIISSLLFYFYYKSSKIKGLLIEESKKILQNEKEQTQKELMNSVLHLEKKNEILTELKKKLLSQNKDQPATIKDSIFKTIDEGLTVDDDFEKFKNNFNTIYPEFFNRLQLKAKNALTPLDLKYCGYILMKVSNKEMASQMNVEPKSIRMARYRIKQKLELSKEEDLDMYIQQSK